MNKRIQCSRILFTAAICSIVLLATGCGRGDKAYEKGLALTESGEYTEAVEQFEKAIAANKEKAEYYIGYGMTLNKLSRYSEAIVQFELGRQDTVNSIANRNNKQICLGEAIAYYNLGEYQKVITLCEEGVEYQEPVQLNSSLKGTHAAALQMLGQDEKALTMYNEILETDEKAWDIYLKRAGLKEDMEDYTGASEDYHTVIAGDPKEYDAYFGLYRLNRNLGQQEEARQVLEQLLSGDAKTPEEICQFGRASYYLEDYEQATASLEEAREGGSAEANYYLGLVKMKQEDYESALNCFDAYLEAREYPESAMVYNQIAGCYIAQRDYEQALEYINTGLERSDTLSRRILMQNQVILYEKIGEYKTAQNYAESYLELYPSDTAMADELEFIKTRIHNKSAAKTSDGTSGSDGTESDTESEAETSDGSDSLSDSAGGTVSVNDENSGSAEGDGTAGAGSTDDDAGTTASAEPVSTGDVQSRGGYADVSDENVVTEEDAAR